MSEAIERLLAEAEELPDPRARALAKSLAAAMIDLVGAGLARVIELDPALAPQLASDPLVGNLLVLCGMHPEPAIVRAGAALAAATTELGSIGVRFTTIELFNDGARVVLTSERGSAPVAERVQAMVEAIVLGRAPDLGEIVIEVSGMIVPGFVPIDRLRVIQ